MQQITPKPIMLQCEGGEAKGNLSWNFDSVFRHNTGRGLRVLWDKGKITML